MSCLTFDTLLLFSSLLTLTNRVERAERSAFTQWSGSSGPRLHGYDFDDIYFGPVWAIIYISGVFWRVKTQALPGGLLYYSTISFPFSLAEQTCVRVFCLAVTNFSSSLWLNFDRRCFRMAVGAREGRVVMD
jgi:hypothetical protein